MNYPANLDSARAFMKVGRNDKALESLNRALESVAPAERIESNGAYLRILTLLAKIHLSEARPDQSAVFIEQGLSVKANDCDLLFLKALLFLDRHRYDEMLAMIVMYFLALADAAGRDYEYASEAALREIYQNLLPIAYRRSRTRGEVADVVRRTAQATNHPGLVKAVEIMAQLDRRAAESPRENGHD